jgi:hypothetical protein
MMLLFGAALKGYSIGSLKLLPLLISLMQYKETPYNSPIYWRVISDVFIKFLISLACEIVSF